MKKIYLFVLLLVYTIGTYSQNTSLTVGTIPGNFNVSSTGAANYVIPIECPKGFAGLQPNIALVYNSQSGDNIAGWGWGISGLSSIRKGTKNIFSDNSVTGFDVLKQDKFILDGKNLVLVSGAYGGVGAVYKFENDDFTRITSIGQNTTQSPLCFKVETKDGKVIEYTRRTFPKNTDRDVINALPYQWLPERITDVNGNFIRITYFRERFFSSQDLISKVEYAGNVDDNKSYASIDFAYTSKSKVRKYYMNAYYIEDHALLSGITISSKTGTSIQKLKAYKLFYKIENEENFLAEVQLEDADNCKINSTYFTWGNDNKDIKIINFRMPSAMEPVNTYFTTADVNGDGKSDLVRLHYDGVLNKEIVEVYKVVTNDGIPSRTERIARYDPGVNYMDHNWKILKGHFLFVNTNEGGQAKRVVLPRFVSSSGGSYIDFMIYTSLTGGVTISQKCNYTSEMPIYASGDINNDGCDEIVSMERFEQLQDPSDVCRIFYLNKLPNGNSNYINLPSAMYKPDKLFIEDFDGDGLKDLCIVAENGTYFLKNMGGKFENGVVKPSFSLVKTLYIYSYYSEIQLGDFNGDGLSDFIINEHCNSTWRLVLNSGNFTFSDQVMPNITAVEEDFTSNNDDKDECIVMDFDHDGKSDLIIVESVYNKKHSRGTYDRTDITFYRSNGESFDKAHFLQVNDEAFLFCKNHAVGDFDGDGREELFSYGSDIYNGTKTERNAFFYNSHNTNYAHKRIKTITDGFENKIEITYQPLCCDKTDNGETYYSRPNSRYYPLVNISAPLYCVRSVKTAKGETISYTYKDATTHVSGKGFLGFGEISAKSDRTQHVSTTSTSWHWSYYMPEQQSVLITDGNKNKISESFASFTNLKVDNTYQTRPLKRRETDYLRSLIKTTDYLSYDNCNNLLQEKISYSTGSTVIDYKHESPLMSPYLIGQLSERTITHNYNGDIWTKKEVITYNPQHLPKSKINYVGRYGDKKTGETVWTYNNRGSVLTEKSSPYLSANFLGATYTYDSQERLVRSKDEFEHTTEYSQYNKWGKAEKIVDFMGNSTTYSFDSFGRRVSATHPDGIVESSSISWSSNLGKYMETQTTTGKPISKIYYDSFGREIRSAIQRFDGDWIYTDRQYDANGNLKKLTLPYKGGASVNWSTYEYDIYNRPVNITDTSGKVTSWSYSGNTVSERKDGITTNKIYDALGRLTKVTDPAGTITYSYNANGQLRSAVAPGNVTTAFEYDDFGRRISIIDPSAGIKTYTYDAEGNVNSETDANDKEIRMAYDEYGQMIQKEYVGELKTDYIYTDNILLSEVSDNGTRKEYAYDELLRVTQEKTTACGKCLIKDFTFKDGNVSETNYKYNTGGADLILGIEQYIYNLGSLTGIRWNNSKTIWTLTGENSLGMVSSCTTGGMKHTYSYDIAGHPISQVVNYNNKDIQNFSYNFDVQSGNLLWRKDNTRNLAENFSYDGLNRLVSFGGRTASYNEKGNITNFSDIGTFEYNISGKPYAVSAVIPVTDTIDTPIHLIAVGYNGMMRPERISQSIRKIVNFEYNGDGERVSMFVANGTRMRPSGVYYYYIGNRYESNKYYGTNTEGEFFYVGGDAYSAPAVLVKEFNSDWKLYYICRDYLGSITHIIDESGNIKQELSYDAWGNLRDPETHKLCNFDTDKGFPTLFLGRGYTGHEHLAGFGLINMNSRLYDPLLGRFLSPDPYVQAPENSQNFNRYSYCLNNPLLYTDTTGEYIGVDDLIAAGIGAFMNLMLNWNNLGSDNVWKSIGKGFAAFGAGAVGGWGSLYPEFGGWAWGGATVGATNSWLSGSEGWDIVAGAGIGVVTGYAGGLAAEYGGQYVGNLLINGTKITSPVLQGTISGTLGGAMGGYASGFTGGLIMTGDVGEANRYGLKGLGIGSAVGSITGTVTGYKYAKDQGLGLWSGKDQLLGNQNTKIDYAPDPYGDNVALYRGTTGSEGKGGDLFMTDNAEYAATYVKNGGQVVKVTISRFTLKQLENMGYVRSYNGMHGDFNAMEYEISSKIALDFIKLFKY